MFVILSAAMPSRLLPAFPAGVPISRVPLDVAIARVEEFLPETGRWQTRVAGLTEGAPSTPELTLGGPPPLAGED
jgi:ATP-dependent DNA helicase DinG